MPSFVKRQSQVAAEYATLPGIVTDPMRAHISGPHAALHRYSVAAEKALINLGEYDPAIDTAYDWPGRDEDSKIDLAYTKLFIDDALLRFFSDLVGVNSTIAPVSGFPSRVRSSSIAFKDNGDFDRSALLLRDVKLNDIVYVRGSSGPTGYDLWTYVKGFKGEVIAAVTGTEEDADSNKTVQSASTSIDRLAGAENCITLTANGSGYDGLAEGDIDESYTIEVISGSLGGDLTTARLRIASASGNDDVSSKAPSVHGGWTEIGIRGLLVEFDNDGSTSCSSAADGEGVAPDDLIAGQKWRVRVRQAFTPATAASSGTYTGTEDTTYIVEVTTGGLFADEPKITVSTTTGVDVSGPTTVVASGTAVVVGSKGVRITFTGTALCQNDKYYIPATAEAEGAMQTLILGHDLPTEIQAAADLDLKLFIKKNIEVGKNRTGHAPDVNWEAAESGFTTSDGILAFDAEWLDGSGDEVELDVVGGTLYVQYREWLTTFAEAIGSLSLPEDVEDALGPTHPDNPLACGVLKALNNSHGGAVHFTSVSDPDSVASWTVALGQVAGSASNYNLVPLTHLLAVQTLYAAQSNTDSSPEEALPRACLFNLQAVTLKARVSIDTSDDDAVVLATLADNPAVSGTQYTYAHISSGNAEISSLGVVAGDTMRFLFTTDGFGNEDYTEFVISEVINETSFVLSSGHTVAISTPQKVEIWHRMTKAEIAADLATRATAFGSSRVCVAWPDSIGSGGVTMNGYFLCAAMAGLRSGVAPQQGLTNVEIAGFDDVSRTVQFFNNSQLNTMKAGGVWVVSQDAAGVVYSRHAVTTDSSDVNHSEEQVRANLDSIFYIVYGNLQQFIGSANVTPETLTNMRVQIEAALEFLKTSGFTTTLGGQILAGEIIELAQHSILRDRVTVTLGLVVSYPTNVILLTLVV